MPEATRTVVIGSRVGLHARSAGTFVQAAGKSGHAVTITTASGESTNAASILGVLALGVGGGDTITLTVTGDNAETAADALATLLESDLDAE